VLVIQQQSVIVLFVKLLQQQPIEQFIFAVAFVEFVLLVKPVKLLK